MIILLNGPPRSGKDTAAHIILRNFKPWSEYKMSLPLKAGLREFFAIDREMHRSVEEHKEDEIDLFFGYSYRQMQISLSEDWAKAKFGTHIFGSLAVRAIKARSSNVVISDCGFEEEIVSIRNAFPGNVLLIRLHRSGCDFSNDSRGYIPDGVIDEHLVQDINNAYDLEMFEVQVIKALRKWKLEPRE